jgi:hypothetical protein
VPVLIGDCHAAPLQRPRARPPPRTHQEHPVGTRRRLCRAAPHQHGLRRLSLRRGCSILPDPGWHASTEGPDVSPYARAASATWLAHLPPVRPWSSQNREAGVTELIRSLAARFPLWSPLAASVRHPGIASNSLHVFWQPTMHLGRRSCCMSGGGCCLACCRGCLTGCLTGCPSIARHEASSCHRCHRSRLGNLRLTLPLRHRYHCRSLASGFRHVRG